MDLAAEAGETATMADPSDSRAVLFADVSGSTRLYELLGNQRALECIGLCLKIMRESTVEQGGIVVKTIGDEVMSVFSSPAAAARAAADMQARVGMQDPVSGQKLAIRIGMQFGPVIERATDVFGDCVNVAARMAGMANPGQILTTKEFVEKLPVDLRSMTRSLDSYSVKGKEDEVAICEIFAHTSEEMTTITDRQTTAAVVIRLRLRHSGREWTADPNTKVITFGRDATGDFVIADRKASRHHARIERRRDKYVLIDLSSNGTFVTFRGQPEIGVRREEIVLHGRGSMSFGHPYADDPTEIVSFEIEA